MVVVLVPRYCPNSSKLIPAYVLLQDVGASLLPGSGRGNYKSKYVDIFFYAVVPTSATV